MNVLKYIAAAGVPVLICLTHADKLISEIMPGVGNLPDVLHSQKCIASARQVHMYVHCTYIYTCRTYIHTYILHINFDKVIICNEVSIMTESRNVYGVLPAPQYCSLVCT